MKTKILAVSLVILFLLNQFSSPAVSKQGDYTCGYSGLIDGMLTRTNTTAYTNWIKRLSGEVPVSIAGQQTSLETRYTPAMFLAQSTNARAFEYVEQQVRRLLLDSQVAQHAYTIYYVPNYTAKNLVVDLRGTVFPDEVVVLSAHLDSISSSPWMDAPGADDNATGAAALLEAARLLRNGHFKRTIRLIWFTGEEQGLKGSYAYVNDPAVDTSQIVGDINLDMFGYDADDDHCFELHVGTLPASNTVGQCITSAINAYNLDLNYDYITSGAIGASDHAAFWSKNIGAVEVLENYSDNQLAGGCAGRDVNPNYHKITDTLANMHPAYAFEIARAGIAAAAGLAEPINLCLNGSAPILTDATTLLGSISLSWDAVKNASGYRVFRSSEACGGDIEQTADVPDTSWEDRRIVDGRTYYYWVEAFSPEGCFSLSDGCAVLQAEAFSTYLPTIHK